MSDDKLNEYVNGARNRKIPEVEIRNELLNAGWKESDIDSVLNPNKLLVPKPPVTTSDEGKAIGMWDAFEHGIMFISLYVLATSLGLILSYYVDRWFPSMGGLRYRISSNEDYDYSVLSAYYSALIVSAPVFVGFFLAIRRKTKNNPAIRDLRSRKQLIYLTLIITFIIVLANLITIIYKFLNGNITLNFVMHFLVIIGISGSIFGYYINQVSQDRKV